MKSGWKEVARLGIDGVGYPHVLVDSHGWCLRLGADPRADDKYYSSLPSLLSGAVNHAVRRRMMALSDSLDLQGLCREVRDALDTALGLCHEALAKGGLEEHIRRLEPGEPGETVGRTLSAGHVAPRGIQAIRDPDKGRQAV